VTVRQLTREECIAFAESKGWEKLTVEARALAGLQQERLFMPFEVLDKAVVQLLGRPVYTHEYATPAALLAEYRGEVKAPTLEEVLALIPPETLIVVTPWPDSSPASLSPPPSRWRTRTRG